MALYRECGFPLVDQVMAGSVLAIDATDEEHDSLFLLLNCARDFVSDDPAIWAEAETVLTAINALGREKAAGRIDNAAYISRGAEILARCSPDITLAVFNLSRSNLAASMHVRLRARSRN